MVICSGQYIDSLDYNFPSQGNFTEVVSFVGSSKIWATGTPTNFFSGQFSSGYFGGPAGPDTPPSGVERRENLNMTVSRWPTQINGITTGGVNTDGGTAFAAHLENVKVSCNLGRTDLFELGRKKEYYKAVKVPVDVNTTIDVIVNEFMDIIDARNDGTSNIFNQTIRIRTANNEELYLGTKNTVQSVTWNGIDTESEAYRISLQYKNLNSLYISAPQSDPAGFAHSA